MLPLRRNRPPRPPREKNLRMESMIPLAFLRSLKLQLRTLQRPQPQPRISLIKAFPRIGPNSFRRPRNFTGRLAMAANAKDATILA